MTRLGMAWVAMDIDIDLNWLVLAWLDVLQVADEEKCQWAREIAGEWESLSRASRRALHLAENTEAFWRSQPSLRKTFCTSTRRVVMHSKSVPLHLNKVLSGSTW